MVRSARLLLCCALVAWPAFADEPLRTPGEQVLDALRDALAKGETARAEALLTEAGELYAWPASTRERDQLFEAIAAATRAPQPAVCCAALRALGATGSPKAAEQVEPFLRELRTGADGESVAIAAVRAAGRLRHRSLVAPLVKLAQKSSHMTVADQALLALGEWCREPDAARKQVVEKVLSTTNSLRRDRRRWNRLRAPALRALQRLCDRKLNSYQMFLNWWKHAKTTRRPFG